jgi:thioredoxin-related protein
MKISLLLLNLFLLAGVVRAQEPMPASDVLKAASAQAKKEHKNVMVIFHASWCVWCHRLDSAMNDASCKDAFTSNYVIEHLTIKESKDKKALENPGATELFTKYAGDKEGIPFFLIFDKKGKLLADSKIRDAQHPDGANMGCPAEPSEVEAFAAILRKTSRMSDAQIAAIEERFKKIKTTH